MSAHDGPPEPDAAALHLAAAALREYARAARGFAARARTPELIAAYERELLTCEQVGEWLQQRADRMNV